jgi:hypothetical protein
MKKLMIAALIAGFAVSPAFANGLEEHCTAYAADNGSDPSGCSCLADAADASMAEELMSVASEADLEGLSDASKEAIASCWPDAG